MREVSVSLGIEARRLAKPVGFALLLFGLGVLVGSVFFPAIVIQVVERRVEVPVERIVDRKVPVEVIKYVDRVVEKRVEVPVERIVEKRVEIQVEKRVEVPVDRIVFREKPAPAKLATFSRGQNQWRDLYVGMSRSEVRRILGSPRESEGDGVAVIESWYYGGNTTYGSPASVRFGSAGVIGWDPP